jgi:hypothetical protein
MVDPAAAATVSTLVKRMGVVLVEGVAVAESSRRGDRQRRQKSPSTLARHGWRRGRLALAAGEEKIGACE